MNAKKVAPVKKAAVPHRQVAKVKPVPKQPVKKLATPKPAAPKVKEATKEVNPDISEETADLLNAA